MNEQKVEQIRIHLAEIMKILEMPINNSTEKTDFRIAKMWVNETLVNMNNRTITKLHDKMKVFDNVDDLHELVIVKDIPFFSTCEHHLLPFFGKISVGYVPNDSVIGLSKIPRVIEYFSKKPQLQERLVKEIGNYIYEVVNPKCIFVIARDTTHTCVLCRGVESECDTDTFYWHSESETLNNNMIKIYKKEFFERIRR